MYAGQFFPRDCQIVVFILHDNRQLLSKATLEVVGKIL